MVLTHNGVSCNFDCNGNGDGRFSRGADEGSRGEASGVNRWRAAPTLMK